LLSEVYVVIVVFLYILHCVYIVLLL